MDKSSDLINPFNKIKSTINNNQDIKYAAQGRTNRFKEEIEKLNFKIQLLGIDKINADIAEFEPIVKTMENQYKVLSETLPIIEESLVVHHSHLECVKKKLIKQKERFDKTVDDYSKEYEKKKGKLESFNETYRTLKEKNSELKRCEYNIMKQKNDMKQLKWKKAYGLEIKKKIFYADSISLAKNWLAKKNYDDLVKKEKDVEKTLTELVKEVVDISAKIKNKQTMNLLKRTLQNRQATNNDLEKKIFTVPVAAPPRSVLSQKMRTLDTLNARSSQSCEPLKNVHSQNLFANNQLVLAVPKKITVLENSVIQTAKKDADMDTKKREEKSKALKAKLEKVVQDFKAKRLSQSNIKSPSSFRSNYSMEKAGTPEKRDEAEADTNVVSSTPLNKSNPNSQSGPEALDNLNFISQDVSAFKYDPIIRSNEEKNIAQRTNNIQLKTNIEEKKFGTDPTFPERQGINNPLAELVKTNIGTPGMMISQVDKNNTMPNLPFVNNLPKHSQNQNFNTRSFTPRPGPSSYNPQSQQFAYSQNAFNPAKRQKLEESQQVNSPFPPVPSTMGYPENYNLQNPNIQQLGENVDNYNFGNVSQFLNNSGDGDFNTLYGINPDQSGMADQFSQPDYSYGGGQSDEYTPAGFTFKY